MPVEWLLVAGALWLYIRRPGLRRRELHVQGPGPYRPVATLHRQVARLPAFAARRRVEPRLAHCLGRDEELAGGRLASQPMGHVHRVAHRAEPGHLRRGPDEPGEGHAGVDPDADREVSLGQDPARLLLDRHPAKSRLEAKPLGHLVVEAFRANYAERSPGYDDAAYSKQWWVLDTKTGLQQASGIYGQLIHIDPARRLVVVKLSSWPDPLSDALSGTTLRAIEAIGRALAGA